jgi:DNA ligase (NAD+)
MIRAMGLQIGCTVSVVKRGEIIPKIEGLAPPGSPNLDMVAPGVPVPAALAEIDFPSVCGICGTTLRDEGTRLLCPNGACPKRLHHRLGKWVHILDIRELGDKLLKQLFDSGRVRNISDLYTLTVEELAEYERMGDTSAAKVIRHIRTKRELPLQKFMAGLDLEGVGELIMERAVSAGYDTLEQLKNASANDLSKIWGIGEITAKTIVQGMADLEVEIHKILATGIISIAVSQKEDQYLQGLSFCFTGELRTIKRNAAIEMVKNLGANVKLTVVKDLSYLVTNDTGTGTEKNEKARKLGIRIIDEDDFLALLEKPAISGLKTAESKKMIQSELF